jgi:hypothetical protein
MSRHTRLRSLEPTLKRLTLPASRSSVTDRLTLAGGVPTRGAVAAAELHKYIVAAEMMFARLDRRSAAYGVAPQALTASTA